MSPPTRSFFISINESLSPFTKEKRKGFTSFQMGNGLWFNTKARLEQSQAVQLEVAKAVEKYINDLIVAESRKLQQFWYNNTPKYFNRRSLGMYYYRGNRGGLISSARRFRGKYKNKQQYPRRQSSGQLRRALVVKNKNQYGCELYVTPCISRNGKPVDYVTILMNGAPSGPNPYIPILDKRIRIPGKFWRGIPKAYWAMWQAVFEKQVNEANKRINAKVEQYLLKIKVIEKQDIRRALTGVKKEKTITEIRREQASRPLVTNFKTDVDKKFRNALRKFQPRFP